MPTILSKQNVKLHFEDANNCEILRLQFRLAYKKRVSNFYEYVLFSQIISCPHAIQNQKMKRSV